MELIKSTNVGYFFKLISNFYVSRKLVGSRSDFWSMENSSINIFEIRCTFKDDSNISKEFALGTLPLLSAKNFFNKKNSSRWVCTLARQQFLGKKVYVGEIKQQIRKNCGLAKEEFLQFFSKRGRRRVVELWLRGQVISGMCVLEILMKVNSSKNFFAVCY